MARPKPHPDFIKMVTGYALTCNMQLPAVSDTITEARYQARKNGRSAIAATDIRCALLDYQIPSDQALKQAFEPEVKWDEGWAIPTTVPNLNPKSVLEHRCMTIALWRGHD